MSCFKNWELIPFGVSSSELIECFLICGYETLLINENISQYIIKNESNIKENELNEFNFYTSPKIYSTISSNFTREMFPIDKAIYYIFPLPNKIYFTKVSTENNIKPDNKYYFIQNGSTSNDKILYNMFCYVFYEEIMILDNKYKVFNPKIFMIISQYTLYNLFRKILIDIRNLFYSNSIEIPIEIQIYNILNFIPAPIHSNLNYFLFQNYNLDKYINTNEEEFINLPDNIKYNSNQLRMYPFYDCNLCEIFKLLPYDILAELYLFIFYEIQIYFFSKDLEKLNIIMNILISLFYQFDSQYNWQIFSVGEYEIKNCVDSVILGKPFSNLTGINVSYSEEYGKELLNPPFICFDYENKEFYYFKKGENDKEKAVMNYIQNIIINQKISGNLDTTIMNLTRSLKDLSNQLGYNNNNNDEKIEFFSDNTSNNKKLLNIFYDFFTNILTILNSIFSFEKLENPKKGKYYVVKFNKKNEINIGNNKEINDFFQNILDYKMDTFIQYIIGSSEPVKSLFCNYQIAECFMIFKKISTLNDKKIEIDYFGLMDQLYEENKTVNIHFYNFFIYYKEKLQNFFSKYIDSDNIIKTIKDNKVIYKYKNIELDKSILLKYTQILNQLSEEEINNIFPSKNILNLPFYIEVKDNKFFNIFDNYVFEKKLISSKELLYISFLMFFTINTEKKQIINLKTTLLGFLWTLNFGVLKYIYRILFVYYKICEIQVKNEDYSILSMIDYYLDIFNVLNSKGILPHNKILYLVNQIYIIYENNKEKLQSQKIENNEIDNFYNNIKNKDIVFTCDLEDNNVKIEDEKKKEEIEVLCENKDLSLIKEETLKIHFNTNEIKNNNDLKCNLYSYYKLFQTINELYKHFIQTFDLKSLDSNILKEIIVNLILYFSKGQIKNKIILKFLLLCLYED